MIDMNLKYLRKAFGYSQEEVAEKINVSRQSVAKWENGETLPIIINCSELASLYGVTVDELISGTVKEMQNKTNGEKQNYFFGFVKVGDRGQIVIPKEAREVFDIKAGDRLIVVGDKDKGMGIAKIGKLGNIIGG